MDEATRRKVNALSSKICRAKKAGDHKLAARYEMEREILKGAKVTIDNGRATVTPRKPRKTTKTRKTIKAAKPFDVAAIRRVMDAMGIAADTEVKVVKTSGQWRRGSCRMMPTPWGMPKSFRITCSTLSDNAAQISETLIHELTHVRQMSQYDSHHAFMLQYKRHGYTGYAYDRNPYEVEARNVAASMVMEHSDLYVSDDAATRARRNHYNAVRGW